MSVVLENEERKLYQLLKANLVLPEINEAGENFPLT